MSDVDLKDKHMMSTLTSVEIDTLDFNIVAKSLAERLLDAGYYLEFNITESYSKVLGFDGATTLHIDAESESDPLNYFELMKDEDHLRLERLVVVDGKLREYRVPFDRLKLVKGSDVRTPTVGITGDVTKAFWLFTDLVVGVIDIYLERLCNIPALTLDDERKPKNVVNNVVELFADK